MKHIALIVFFLSAIASSIAVGAFQPEAPQDDFRSQPNEAFGHGERLVFSIKYGFITAGEAVLSIPGYEEISGRNCYKIVSEVSTSSSFDWVFKVRDRYETYLDVAGVFPWRFEQHVREGKFSFDYSAYFDQRHDTAYTTEGKFTIPKYVHDILSAFFYVRTIDLSQYKTGEKIQLVNFYKKEVHPLEVLVLGRSMVETEAGTFKCVVIEPLVKEGGLFKNEGRIIVWLTDDDRKMPVKILSKVIIGAINVELKEYSGLRGELKAKVKNAD